MSFWYNKNGKSYATKGNATWVKAYADYQITSAKDAIDTRMDRHVSGGAENHRAEDVRYDEKESVKEVIERNANFAVAKTSNLENTMLKKVDKEEGKGLSESNFTPEEKAKLKTVEEGATKGLSLTNQTAYTPTLAYHPATKKYVDDKVQLPEIDLRGQVATFEELLESNLLDRYYENETIKDYCIRFGEVDQKAKLIVAANVGYEIQILSYFGVEETYLYTRYNHSAMWSSWRAVSNDGLQAEVDRLALTKANKTTIAKSTNTAYIFSFSAVDNTEVRIGNAASISFTFGDGEYPEDYTSGLSFDSGETPTAIDYTDSGILNWVGTDCVMTDGLSIFQPSKNTHYDVVFYFNGSQFIGLVNGFVPSVGR